MEKKISFRNVYKSFPPENNCVLKNISIDFFQKKKYAITGQSGSGKSTLLHLIGLLDIPTNGVIAVNDYPTNLFTAKEKKYFFNQTIGFLAQKSLFIYELSVIENVMLPGVIAHVPKEDRIRQAEELLDAIGLIDKKNAAPQSLSGGQQHRVALARALFSKPAFLIADEPTSNLDQATAKAVSQLILRYQEQWNMGLIISTHDPLIISSMEQIITINNGLIE